MASIPSARGRLKRLLLVIVLLTGLGWGCALSARPQAPAVLPPQPTATPEICSTDPPGLSIRVLFERRDEQFQDVTIHGAGFTPGESITIRVIGQGGAHGVTIETLDYLVKADGTFSNADALPLEDAHMHWEVHVIHQRGTACLGFDTAR